ncbi:hypothetical protein D9611_014658 [Ephemerocybe angulata]|uniref:DUF6532 domain-containing protein n=1 Tax=Ephemerocybe angulata TaxID=980116 RepID=A0A8H5ER55_9AGAR|nr:hypothetical protein D9611_014658 [Tulosesus angulatus]
MPEQDDRTLHGSTGTDVEDAGGFRAEQTTLPSKSPKTTTAHSEADYTPRDDPDSDERCQGTDHTEDIDHDTASTASADLPIDNIILETLSAPSRSSTAKESKDLKKTRLSATKESGRKKTRSSNQNPLGSRNRYRLCDFTGPTRVVLNDTIDLFRVFCVTKDPFPEVTGRQLRLAVDSWAKAAERRGIQIAYPHEASSLVTHRTSQIRGRIKSLARPIVQYTYNVSGPSETSTRDKIELLLKDNSFLYSDTIGQKNIYLHPAIQEILNKAWFTSKKDLGPSSPEFADEERGIPLPTIAFIITIIQGSLDEWQSGTHRHVDFSAAGYYGKYLQNLDNLQQFELKTKEEQILPRLRRHLLRTARRHAGAGEVIYNTDSPLSNSVVESAKMDWKDMLLGEEAPLAQGSSSTMAVKI